MDLSTLSEKLELDVKEWEGMVHLFMETTVSDLDALCQAVEGGDASLAVQSSHSIKGASANLGLQEISLVAGEIEMNARRGILAGAREGVDAIRRHLDSLKRFRNR